jgi:predicted ATPase
LIKDQQTLFKDGVYFIPLMDCDTREKLINTIFHQVSGDAERKPNALTELIDWLQYRRALLVLDGVEEVGELRNLVADLLANAPHVVFLCTAYQPLGLIGERILSVRGLEYQSEGVLKDDPPAIKLFFCHLQSESHPQILENSFKERAAEICAMVEGLPLAIDLAASQVREMTVTKCLTGSVKGWKCCPPQLTNLPARQRSVELCFNLAWNNLSHHQQQMLRSLTIFSVLIQSMPRWLSVE